MLWWSLTYYRKTWTNFFFANPIYNCSSWLFDIKKYGEDFHNDPNMRKPACGARILKAQEQGSWHELYQALTGLSPRKNIPLKMVIRIQGRKKLLSLGRGSSFRKRGKYITQVWYSRVLLSCEFESCGLGFYSLR